VDRLDTWLNAQRGWRRPALLLLQIAPVCVLFVFASFDFFDSDHPSGLGFAGDVALGLLAAIASSFLQLLSHDRRDGNARATWAPLVTWRGLVYGPVMCGPLLLVATTINASPAWHQRHGQAVHIAIFILVPCMGFVTFERARYSTRLRKRQNYYAS